MKLNKLALINGVDIFFEDQFLIHSPTFKELGENNVSEEDLFKALRLLTINKSSLEDTMTKQLENISNFRLFLSVVFNPAFDKNDRKKIFEILQLLLKNYKLAFSDKVGFVLNDENQEKFFNINEQNFDIFQEYIKEIFCLNKIFPQENEYNVKSEKAKRIAAQLKERHKKLAEQNQNEIGAVLSSYESILSIGMSLSLEELGNYTVYQLFYSLDRFTLYYSYDLDVRCKLAGGSGDSKPENWMKIM